MAKAKSEETAAPPSPLQGQEISPTPPLKGEGTGERLTEAPEGVPLVTVLYSIHRDVYKVPSAASTFWLSVLTYADADQHPSVQTADGHAWRRIYTGWTAAQPGAAVTLPMDDPLVVDYLRQTEAERL